MAFQTPHVASKSVHGLDVAVTFDFHSADPAAVARSEAQALFFLAGWSRHAAKRVPLRMICVGEPPDTVLSLAERSRAEVMVRAPLVLENGTVLNRALGWTAPGDSNRRLVLSSEMLVLGNFMPALAALPVGCLSAAPADKAPLPEAAWERVYRSLDLPSPTERMRPLRVELKLRDAGTAAKEMLPYYHGAVLLAPRSWELGRIWTSHFLRLAEVLPALENIPPRLGEKLAGNGKVALATACQAVLVDAGQSYRRLPRICDGRLPYFESAAGAGSIRLLHVPSLFGGLADLGQIQQYLRAYVARLRGAVEPEVRRRGGGPLRVRLTAAWRARPIESALRRMYLHEVRPALRRCGAYG